MLLSVLPTVFTAAIAHGGRGGEAVQAHEEALEGHDQFVTFVAAPGTDGLAVSVPPGERWHLVGIALS
ncbi:hypothetical protein [Streptomyces cellostaticus]|uniref:hypothetical protein n=1 Tax=Streptomyces cellostaticus TaxID=67285 RepID=UPI002026242E|nr:hypothetical protein [Streptomyces cellostaticus]